MMKYPERALQASSRPSPGAPKPQTLARLDCLPLKSELVSSHKTPNSSRITELMVWMPFGLLVFVHFRPSMRRSIQISDVIEMLEAPPTPGGGAAVAVTLESWGFDCSKGLNVGKCGDQTGFQTLLFAHEDPFWFLETRPSVNVTRPNLRSHEAAPGEDVLTHRSVASSVRLLLKQTPPKKLVSVIYSRSAGSSLHSCKQRRLWRTRSSLQGAGPQETPLPGLTRRVQTQASVTQLTGQRAICSPYSNGAPQVRTRGGSRSELPVDAGRRPRKRA